MKISSGLIMWTLSASKYIVILMLVCGLIGSAHAEMDTPENTVKAFYGHIAKHECEQAVRLAIGYSRLRCEDIRSLSLGPVIKRAGETPNRVVLEFTVSYEQVSVPAESTCELGLSLSQHDGKWLVEFPPLTTHNCTAKESHATHKGSLVWSNQGIPAEKPANPVRDAGAAKVPPAEVKRPAVIPPLTQPTADGGKPAGLLQTWNADELKGQPGDERIIKLRPPDHTPPQRTQATEKLPNLAEVRFDSIRRVRLPDGKKLVALTFDLCEQADDRTGYDRSIVNTLREKKVAATFFAGGKWMRSHEDKTLQLMADPNFEIGNHGWTHGNLHVLKGQAMRDQIVWTQAEYERIWEILNRRAKSAGLEKQMAGIPRQPLTLRFPYGTCSAEALQAVNGLGLSAIQWDVVSGDAAPGLSPAQMARRVIQEAKPGSVIVFHGNGRGHGTAAALPAIIDGLTGKGFGFVTVSRLLDEGVPETAKACYETRPGDNLRYDQLFGGGTE